MRRLADALPERDFTAKVLLEGLPFGQEIFYRVRPQDLGVARGRGAGRNFRTAPVRSARCRSSGPAIPRGRAGASMTRGGMRTYRTMLNNRPDFFIHSGDSIYADCPIERELKLPDGGVWRNLITEEKSVVAQTLEQFRGNYKYNLARRQCPRLQCRGAPPRAVGRP